MARWTRTVRASTSSWPPFRPTRRAGSPPTTRTRASRNTAATSSPLRSRFPCGGGLGRGGGVRAARDVGEGSGRHPNGERRRVPAAELVPGDVILIEEGDTIAADGRLTESAALKAAGEHGVVDAESEQDRGEKD